MKRIYKIKSSHVTTEPLLDKVICKSTILLRMIETGLEFLEKSSINLPANIRLDEDVLLEDIFGLRLQKTSPRRLQDVLIKKNIFALLICLQKTCSRHLVKTSSRRLQDVFKTSSRHLQDALKTSSGRLQNIFKISSRHLQDVFKTFS